jgi:hypothetical protein
MKSLLACSVALFAAASLFAADKDDVKSAADKLAAAENYSWSSKMESPQFNPPPTQGKATKDGLTWQKGAFQDNEWEAVAKDGKGAVKDEDGWHSLDEYAKSGDSGNGFNFHGFMATRIRTFKAPAAQAAEMLEKCSAVTKTGDTYTAEMTEDGAKSLMTMGGRRGGQAPAISNAKGKIKFWIKDGVLTKYESNVTGSMKDRNGDDTDIDRTTTVEIKDIGTTKLTVPDEAKKKLS